MVHPDGPRLGQALRMGEIDRPGGHLDADDRRRANPLGAFGQIRAWLLGDSSIICKHDSYDNDDDEDDEDK